QQATVAAEDAGAARTRRHEAEQYPEQRRLAGAIGADDGMDAPARDAQVEMVEGELVAVALGQRHGFDHVVRVHSREIRWGQADLRGASARNSWCSRACTSPGV